MLTSDTAEKENVQHTTEVINGKKSSQPSSASILKPTRRPNLIEFSPRPNDLTLKSSSKVTFKNTPVCYRPPRYRVEDLPPCWEELRKLDEVENWTERTSVVTKEDHQEYLEAARAIIEELISGLPCVREEEATDTMSTEANTDDKPKKKPRQRFVKPVRPKGQKNNGDFFIDFGLESPQTSVPDVNPEQSSPLEERPKLSSTTNEADDAKPQGTPTLDGENGGAVEKTSSLEELSLLEKPESSDSNRLEVNTDDSPRAFSPIGSERTSPELENLTGSNEDISKLLMPHDDLADNGSSQPPDSVQTPLSPSHADDLLQQMTSLKSQTNQLAEQFASETSQLLEKSIGSIDACGETETNVDTGAAGSASEDNKSEVEKTFENLGTSDAADDGQLSDDVTKGNTSAESGTAKLSVDNENDVTGIETAAGSLNQTTGFEDQSAEVFGLTDDDFKSANDAFSLELDFLEKCGSSNDMDKLSALARQSLYVKFDPLVKGSNSPQTRAGPLASLGGGDLLQMNTPPHQVPKSLAARLAAMKDKDRAHESLQGVDQLLNFSPAKKPPHVEATDDVSEEQPARTEPSAAPTNADSSKVDFASDDSRLVQPLLYCKADLEVAVKKERETVLAQAYEESAIREMEIQELEKKLQQQTSENMKLKKDNDELKQVMLEYEKTMAEMIETGQKSQSDHDKSTDEVKKERDQIQADLNSVEAAFSDLHRRYEKLKGAVENYKKNEAILLKAAKDYQEKQKRSEEKYLMLKKHAEEKIEVANVEISRVRKSNESEMAVMKAALKKEQTRVLSLEQTLQQKVHENKELTAICDELISRVGGK